MSDTIPKKRLGLLERANLASKPLSKPETICYENMPNAEKAIVSFHQFASIFKLEKAVVFVRQRDTYALTITHNIGEEALQNPETPSLFWEAMYFTKYNEESWLTFYGDHMRSFLTLFSKSEQTSTEGILLKTFEYNDKKMILCILKSKDSDFPISFDEMESHFSTILPSIYSANLSGIQPAHGNILTSRITEGLNRDYSAQLLSLFFSPAFDKYNDAVTCIDKSVIMNSIFNELSVLMGNHNICSPADNYSFSLVFLTKEVFSANTYFELIREKLLTFFNDNSINMISVQDNGSTNSNQEILDFLARKL